MRQYTNDVIFEVKQKLPFVDRVNNGGGGVFFAKGRRRFCLVEEEKVLCLEVLSEGDEERLSWGISLLWELVFCRMCEEGWVSISSSLLVLSLLRLEGGTKNILMSEDQMGIWKKR